MVVRSSPRLGEEITISSPGLSQTRGWRMLPTPEGVPVETMSPGSRVIHRESLATSSGTEKTRSEVDACEYPDSRKVAVFAGESGDRRLSNVFRAETTVDYYDREPL